MQQNDHERPRTESLRRPNKLTGEEEGKGGGGEVGADAGLAESSFRLNGWRCQRGHITHLFDLLNLSLTGPS